MGKWEVGKWRSGEVGKWRSGEVEKWRSGELIYGGGWSRTRIQKDGKEKFLFSPVHFAKRVRCPGVLGHLGPLRHLTTNIPTLTRPPSPTPHNISSESQGPL